MPQKKRGQIPVEEAVARILNALDVPEKTEETPLLQALGRVAAGDVCARVAQPPFDRSALDGYALRAADIAGLHTKREGFLRDFFLQGVHLRSPLPYRSWLTRDV